MDILTKPDISHNYPVEEIEPELETSFSNLEDPIFSRLNTPSPLATNSPSGSNDSAYRHRPYRIRF